MKTHLLVLTIVVTFATPKAFAQITHYHHSATAAEAYLRGLADLMNCTGLYNLNTAKAMEHLEAARTQGLLNDALYHELKAALKAKNRAAIKERLARTVAYWNRKREERERLPARFAEDQFDAQRGLLIWPRALKAVDPQTRRKIDSLVSKWCVRHGALDANDRSALKASLADCRLMLAARVKKIRTPDYVVASAFLTQTLKVVASERPRNVAIASATAATVAAAH